MAKELKVAIVHDWLITGGAERVVFELHQMYPEAPIYSSYCTPEWRQRLDNKVVTGFLQRWPFPKLRKFVPFLRIWWFSGLKLTGYDLIISSSGAEAKGIKPPKSTPHIAYIHAPTHYYWSKYDQYMEQPGFGAFDPIARIGLRLLIKPLRRWDFKAAQKPDYLVANSCYTQTGIMKYYHRKSTVVHPPVNIKRFTDATPALKRSGFIILGRHTPYKRFDLAVQACTQLNVPLTVVGGGPETAHLKKIAGPTITFTGLSTDEEVVDLVAGAQAFIFPGVDDFGIAPVEALAAGTPVIAYQAAGALDYVTPQTGLFFAEQTVESLVAAIQSFNSEDYSSEEIKKASQVFSTAQFQKNMTTVINKVL